MDPRFGGCEEGAECRVSARKFVWGDPPLTPFGSARANFALRTYLLDKSPYLSTEALQEMVARNSMPQAMQVEVMIANPDATRRDGFIQWVELNAPVPFPTYMLAQVEASWDERTYRTTLEEQMGEHHANMTQAANALLQYYAKDTVGEPIDSLRWVWQQVRTPAARYAEALTYMAQGNYPSANEVVEDIPEEHDLKAPEMVERQRMLDLIAFLQGVQLDGRTEAELDSVEVDALEALVADAHDRPAVWAQNLLCYAYDRCRSWPTGGDGMDWRALSAGQNEQPTFEPSGLRINPNPAETWVALNNKLPKAAPTGELRLLDVTGRLLWSRKLADTYGQVVVDTRTWSTGSYTVELRQGERTLATERLLVKN
ncbi:MAG TPA: hypothetical protein PKE53_16630 [Flavobacteriales bacterium]|nr:hypothetical protein [Flavobacteriales bacterium]